MMKPQEDKVCTPALSLLPLPWTDHHLSKYAASFVKEREMAPKVLKGPSTLGSGYRSWGMVASGCIPKRMSLNVVSISFDCLDLPVLKRT